MTPIEFIAQANTLAQTYSQEHSVPVLVCTVGGPTGYLGASAFHGCTEVEIWQFLAALRSMENSARAAFLNGSEEEPQAALERLAGG